MPRMDTIDRTKANFNFSEMKQKLQSQLAQYQQAVEEVKRELDALAIIEGSKYLAIESRTDRSRSQTSLFSKSSLKDRMIATVNTMPEKFTRMEFFECVKKTGEANDGSLSVYFPQLKAEGYIMVLEEPHGHQPGYYTKGNRHE